MVDFNHIIRINPKKRFGGDKQVVIIQQIQLSYLYY
ncbi:hypothetical protein SAMN05216365_102118 [Porphyromonadaceae bacterium NLAE-zl-C104]|nr:hypothetical protein SAMN05216331_11942 [Porphyromonadaceae bacterium KH3R12]SFS33317.1 hypothetical protein SAMN05216365_102118 [Porphyromonadaceae bacterium NLAE-zl-C104]